MPVVTGLLLVTGFCPWWRAWRANRETSLRHALLWAGAAWLAWTAARALPGLGEERGLYLALSLSGCAGVAVLGARRPGVGAWNFVVVGLLAVLLLPVAQGLGEPRPEPAQLAFLAVTLAVALGNYLPTRLAPAVVVLGGAWGIALARLVGAAAPRLEWLGDGLLVAGPWVAWAACRVGPRPATEFDRVWFTFRDRFGLVWGQRSRDQFNRAAANAGWPVVLTWHGLRPAGNDVPALPDGALATLHAVLKRFGPEEAG